MYTYKTFFNTFETNVLRVKNTEHTKLICWSSCLFFICSLFSFYKQQYLDGCLLLFGFMISINYWRKPTYSWRRTFDLFYQKGLVIFFFISAIIYINNINQLTLLLGSGIFILIFYIFASLYFIEKQDNWIYFYICFHITAFCTIFYFLFCKDSIACSPIIPHKILF